MATGTVKHVKILKHIYHDLTIASTTINAGSFKDIDTGVVANTGFVGIIPVYGGDPACFIANNWKTSTDSHIKVTIQNTSGSNKTITKVAFRQLYEE